MTSDAQERIAKRIEDHLAAIMGREPRMTQWACEDGWYVGYSTERMGDGKFGTYAYRPYGPGARTNRAGTWRLVYERHYAKRATARARALALYRKHSPKWSARHGEVT